MSENVSEFVFNIPSPNLDKFKQRWEKLVRRAAKLNVPEPTYSIIGEEPHTFKVDRVRYNNGNKESYKEDVIILYHKVVIKHELVKINGWEFVSSLEHTEEGNIIHNIGGKDLPSKYRTCGPWCDHCKLNRSRNDTFVIVNDDGVYKQIGRNCLALFFGIDGSNIANMAEIYSIANELASASESEDAENWGSSPATFDVLETFLSHVAQVISIEGWRSRKTASEVGDLSTSDIAYSHLHPSPYFSNRLYAEPSDKSIEIAKSAIEWCENLSDEEVNDNEYLHNIRVIARRGFIGNRQYGYAASIVSAYNKSITDRINKERRERIKEESNFVGMIGKRQNFIVMVEKVLQFDGAYGPTHMHIMTDELGNRLTWKSSSTVLDIGIMFVIKGTVKNHEEYRGIKQTILTRCQVVN